MKSLAAGHGLSSAARPWAVFVVAGLGLALAVGCNGPLGRPYGTAYPYGGGNVALGPGAVGVQTVSTGYAPGPVTFASTSAFAPTTFASTGYAPTTFASSPMVASVSTGSPFASPSPYPMIAQIDRPGLVGGGTAIYGGHRRPSHHMAISALPGSHTGRRRFQRAGLPGRAQNAERADGVPATPGEDLVYRGGKTIKDLQFMNIYVGGTSVWDPNDVKQIDWALGAAMADRNLNNVIMQYFNNQPVSATSLHSQYLTMPQPRTVSQGDVEALVTDLYNQGAFKGYALGSTLFNFMLPRGTLLNDNAERTGQQATVQTHAEEKEKKNKFIPDADEGDSNTGLGGYHGSVHIGGDTVYYAVGVYSERRADGTANGIPVFDKSWKNVVATFYHELQEARTDPDVEDAIKGGDDPSGANYLGWTSEQGEEIGDFPVSEVSQLGLVFREVPLADGSGTVPIQLVYSNAVHGPEGPIAQPHGGVAPPITPAPKPPNSPSPPPTAGNDPDLNRVIKSWPALPQQVKTAVLSVIDVPCR